jgi:hypothetical protein
MVLLKIISGPITRDGQSTILFRPIAEEFCFRKKLVAFFFRFLAFI